MISKKDLIDKVKERGLDLGRNPETTLRYYRHLGLIDRSTLKSKGPGRVQAFYPERTLVRLCQIKELQKTGHSLKQIQEKFHPEIGKEILAATLDKEEISLDEKPLSFNQLCEIEKKQGPIRALQILREAVGQKKADEFEALLQRLTESRVKIGKKRAELKKIISEETFKKWEEENKYEPYWEALEKLELKVRGRNCTAKNCNERFIPIKSNQKYCSIRCRNREVKRRHRQRKKELSRELK